MVVEGTPLGMLQAFQALGGCLYFVVSAVVGIRLLILAHRNRTLPELLMGLGFVLGATIGSCVEVAAIVSGELKVEPARVGMLLMIGKSFGVAGLTCAVLFVAWVFRRHERWAIVPTTAAVGAALVGFAGMAAAGTFSSGVIQAPWYWVEAAARLAGPCWLALEAGRYYTLMRRRTRLGLADPVVTNRFLLWTLAGISGVVMIATALPPVVLGQNHPLSHVALLTFGVSGAASATCYWLAFFPPEAYLRRVLARAKAEA